MTNEEKVMFGLECHAKGKCILSADTCQYFDDYCCANNLCSDALALLQKQKETIEKLNKFINGFSRNAVPVVRCKDCIHAQVKDGHDIFCEFVDDGLCHDENWFCADGKRRDDSSYG